MKKHGKKALRNNQNKTSLFPKNDMLYIFPYKFKRKYR